MDDQYRPKWFFEEKKKNLNISLLSLGKIKVLQDVKLLTNTLKKYYKCIK